MIGSRQGTDGGYGEMQFLMKPLNQKTASKTKGDGK